MAAATDITTLMLQMLQRVHEQHQADQKEMQEQRQAAEERHRVDIQQFEETMSRMMKELHLG